MRWIAGLLIPILGGCGMAVLDRPMLTEADTAGAPQFEDGVWLMPDDFDEEDKCTVDAAQPVSKWPQCASWAVHRQGQWFARDGDTGIATKAVPRSALVVSGGDIAIVQIESVEPDDSVTRDPDPTPFHFVAFDNKPATNSKLRALRWWIVMCGTYEPRGAEADDDAAEELVRFPGFDEKCRPASVQVLRAAAEASRPSPEMRLPRFQWVRATLD